MTKLVDSPSAIAATILTSALMTYGGISFFVVSFVMYPPARELFRVADILCLPVPATIVLGIIVAILVLVVLNIRHFATLWNGVVDGVKRSVLPIFSTASEVGHGAVAASVAAFTVVRDSVFGLGVGALWTSALSVSVTVGLTGSSFGGMAIALNALGKDLRAMAEQEGVATVTPWPGPGVLRVRSAPSRRSPPHPFEATACAPFPNAPVPPWA